MHYWKLIEPRWSAKEENIKYCREMQNMPFVDQHAIANSKQNPFTNPLTPLCFTYSCTQEIIAFILKTHCIYETAVVHLT